MFREQVQGSYKDTVKWFAGVADNVVHVTLSDMENDNVFYDHMIHVHGQEQFEIELARLCEYYISNILTEEPDE
mgnify:FL=1|tara:strand:- start:172 stop:393 length:222 start_codon:yes stop_codon:yes gene_type:complete